MCSALAIVPIQAMAQTLPEAVAIALKTNPTLEAQRASLRAISERRVQAMAQRRVQIVGEASYGYSENWSRSISSTGVISNSNRYDNTPTTYGLTATQPIWLAGRVQAARGQADAQIGQAEARLVGAEIGIMRDVVTAYADLKRDLDSVSIRGQNVATLARQLEAARARFEVGDLTKTDVAQVEARYAAGRTAQAAAEARVDASRSAIVRLIGQIPTDLRPTLKEVPGPASLDQALVLARANNPDLLAARYGEAIAKAGARVIEAENRPRASLQASAARSMDSTFDGNRAGSVGVSARLSVPLYTGGIASSRVSEALGNANAARLSALDAERQIVERTSNAWNQVYVARNAVRSTSEQLNAARIAYQGAELEQSVGLRTTLDVLIQQQELLEAELAKSNAEHDLQVATTSLSAVVGMLKPEDFETVRPPAPKARVPMASLPEEPLVLLETALSAIPLPSRVPNGPIGVKQD